MRGKVEFHVLAAKNPQQAMVAIAVAIDEILQRLEQREASQNTWGKWSSEEYVPRSNLDLSAALTPDEAPPTPNAALAAVVARERRVEISGDPDDGVDVQLPAPSEAKMHARSEFEHARLHLHEYLGSGTNWNEAYAKGGPLWLYLGNRELVVSLPTDVKQAMIMDVADESPQDAHEMGRDLLKQPGETGPGSSAMKVGEGTLG